MAQDPGVPEPHNEPKTDPHERRRRLGVTEPEIADAQPDTEQLGIEINNAIERPQEGQPAQPGGSAH
ncbi:MAG: hypothetical protein WAU68_08885 [Vitreimonas sp.]